MSDDADATGASTPATDADVPGTSTRSAEPDVAGASTHPEDLRDRPGEGGPETVLVTGSGDPVGRATALAFREEGWRVYATARDEARLDGLADRGCLTDELDVTDGGNVRRVVKRVTQEAGRVDCLVTATPPGAFGPVEEVPVEDVRAQFEAGVFGPYRLMQRVLPAMRERGDGTIVSVTSVLGRLAPPGTGPYSGASAAVRSVSDALRAEVDEFGVDVVLVEPALVDPGRKSSGDYGALDGAESGEVPTEYEWVHDLLSDVGAIADGGPGSVPPERVAAVVVNAASATMPEPRYPVGTLADVLSKARYLPDDWRDLIFRLVLKRA